MKRILIYIITITFVFILVKANKNYSFCISSVKESGLVLEHGRINTYNFDKDLILTNQQVKMTQDDTFCYFEVEADIVLADHIKGIMTANSIPNRSDMRIRTYMGITNQFVSNCMQPLLYSEKDFTNQRIKEVCSFIDISGHQLNEHILYFGSKKMAVTHIEGTGNEYFGGDQNCWRSNYGNYFYFPHALAIYDNSYLGRTYSNGLYIPNVNEMLISHDGLQILSQSSFLKNLEMENNKIKEAVIGCKTKIKMEKTKINRYKYLAYGGLLYCSSYNHTSSDNTYQEYLNAAFSMTGTFNIASYSDCKHSYEYTYDNNSTTHTKRCRKCEWTTIENHNYLYEYDGIKENMCECGKCTKIKCHFEINDDYNNVIEKEVEPYSNITVYEHKEKEGYEFLYYEKYERKLYVDSNLNYSYSTATKSTLVKDVLVATMSTPDKTIGAKSIIYKSVYTPIRLKVNYHTKLGYMSNNNAYMSKNYTYWGLILEKPKGDFGNEIYFDGYYCLQKIINNEKNIRSLIYRQDQEFDLEAIFNHPEYGKRESGTNEEPATGGGLRSLEDNSNSNRKKKNNEDNEENDNQNDRNLNIKINNKKSKEKNSDNNSDNNNLLKKDINYYKFLLNKLGVQKASYSNVKGEFVCLNNEGFIYLLSILFNKYVLLSFTFSLLLLLALLLKKKNK